MKVEWKHMARIVDSSVICEHGLSCGRCCMLFLGSRTSGGHGHIRIGDTTEYVHRAVYSYITKEDIPEDKQINHVCDVPNCWQIQHLYIGTQKDNIRNIWRKRSRKLTYENKLDIFIQYTSNNDSVVNLASRYGVNTYTIYRVLKNVKLEMIEELRKGGTIIA